MRISNTGMIPYSASQVRFGRKATEKECQEIRTLFLVAPYKKPPVLEKSFVIEASTFPLLGGMITGLRLAKDLLSGVEDKPADSDNKKDAEAVSQDSVFALVKGLSEYRREAMAEYLNDSVLKEGDGYQHIIKATKVREDQLLVEAYYQPKEQQ